LTDVVMRSTRHIITTSVTTVGGFLPLLLSSIFFKPLAWAMTVGVIGATIIALLYIPSLYIIKEKLI
jgi:multidrug efflux pump subunit AcrB